MLRKSIAVTFSGQIGRVFFATIGSSLLARGLGVEERGLYELAVCIPFVLMPLSQFGQVEVNSVFAGTYSSKRPELFMQTVFLGIIFGFLGLLLMNLLFCLPIDRGEFGLLSSDVILLSSFFIPVQALDNMMRELARGAEFITSTVAVTTIGYILRAAALFVFVYWLNKGLISALLIALIIPIFTTLCYIIIMRDFANLKMRNLSMPLIIESLRFGLVFVVSSSAMILIQKTATILLGYLAFAPKDIGLYAVALMFSLQLSVVPTSVAQAFLPQLSNHPHKRLQQTPQVYRLTLIVCLVCMAALAFLSYPLIYILAGKEYINCIYSLLYMLPGIAFFAAARVLGMHLWAIKKPRYGMINNCIVLIINFFIGIVFIPWLGIEGASISYSLSLIILSMLTVRSFCSEVSINWDELIPNKDDLCFLCNEVRSLWKRVKIIL